MKDRCAILTQPELQWASAIGSGGSYSWDVASAEADGCGMAGGACVGGGCVGVVPPGVCERALRRCIRSEMLLLDPGTGVFAVVFGIGGCENDW
jgi:hypothetical protein